MATKSFARKREARLKRLEKPTIAKVQSQVTTIKRKLKKEPLIVIQSVLQGTLSNVPVVVHINPSAGGATNQVELEGSKATIRSLRIKGWFKSVGVNNVAGRLDVILDRTPTAGTIATFDQIYSPAAGAGSINSMMHPQYKSRFKLLASFKGMPNTNDGQLIMFERYIRLNHIIATKNLSTYVQNDQIKNAILISHWADNAANQPTYNFITQTTVVDDN